MNWDARAAGADDGMRRCVDGEPRSAHAAEAQAAQAATDQGRRSSCSATASRRNTACRAIRAGSPCCVSGSPKSDSIIASPIQASAATPPAADAPACPRCLDRLKPSIVIVELGANDALRGVPLATTEDESAHDHRAGISRPRMRKSYSSGCTFHPITAPTTRKSSTASTATVEGEAACRSSRSCWPASRTSLTMFQADQIHPTVRPNPCC